VAQWLYSFGKIDIRTNNHEAFQDACSSGKLEVAKWLHSFWGIRESRL
jgi:hypothetical protein